MKSKINKTFVVFMSLWVIITLLRTIFHQPWFDETHAYMMAKELSLLDIIAQMKYEGHTFIWYLLMMPFAKTDFCYPYAMLLMNWGFVFASLIILWKKAPFNNFTKFAITFSYPFLAQLPVIARCYAIGVLLLFVLCNSYKDALKHPILYSTCVTICANTSVMALFGAVAFGFLYAFDLIKGAIAGNVSRKDFRISFVVLAIGAVLILWQLGGSNSGFFGVNNGFIEHFKQFFINDNLLLDTFNCVVLALAIIFYPIYFWKEKRVLFFAGFTIGGLILTFVIKYAGWTHHYIFFWIYLLISVWMFYVLSESNRVLKLISDILISLVFFGLIFNHITFSPGYYHSGAKFLADIVFQDKQLADSRIILYSWADLRILPYTNYENLDAMYYCSAKKPDSDASLSVSPICDFDNEGGLYPTWLEKSLSKEKNSYIVLPIEGKILPNRFYLEDRNFKMIFEPYKIINKTYGIFKVLKINKNLQL